VKDSIQFARILMIKTDVVEIGGFQLRPDSSSGMRPDDLMVVCPNERILLIQGGELPFSVKLRGDRTTYAGFQKYLSREQKNLLRNLASSLTGWLWPSNEEMLLRKIRKMGDGNVLAALQNLFKGVERTMFLTNILNGIPFIGKKLIKTFFPVQE
jgi:hypothetical protein